MKLTRGIFYILLQILLYSKPRLNAGFGKMKRSL